MTDYVLPGEGDACYGDASVFGAESCTRCPAEIRFPCSEVIRSHLAHKANERQVAGDHYKKMGIEPWDVVDTWPIGQRIGAYRAGALKYLMRLGSKDASLQEAKKCGHYVEKLIETLEATHD